MKSFREGPFPRMCAIIEWSGKRDSNSQHLRWQRSALPLSYFRKVFKWSSRTESNRLPIPYQGIVQPYELQEQYSNICIQNKWCSERDSNSQRLLPQSSVFTNFTIRAKISGTHGGSRTHTILNFKFNAYTYSATRA